MSRVEELSKKILRALLDNFLSQNLGADKLSDGYVGESLAALKTKFCGTDTASTVDFDLALKDLEDRSLAKTGPMAPYENPPGSALLIMMMFSKREYAYLTEKGYKLAQQTQSGRKRRSLTSNVHISGGHFHQSPIGIGNQVIQSIDNTEGDFNTLARVLTNLGIPSDEITHLQRALEEDQGDGGKPSFGGETGNWFTKLLGRAAQGGLSIGVDAISSGVGKALSNYFGS